MCHCDDNRTSKVINGVAFLCYQAKPVDIIYTKVSDALVTMRVTETSVDCGGVRDAAILDPPIDPIFRPMMNTSQYNNGLFFIVPLVIDTTMMAQLRIDPSSGSMTIRPQICYNHCVITLLQFSITYSIE